MSLAVPNVTLGQSEDRLLIVARLDGLTFVVDDEEFKVTAYAQRPSSPSPLDAFVVWDHSEWINAYARAVTWNVYVLLPQTYPEMVDLADVVAEQAGSVLYGIGRIQRAEPVSLALDANQPPAPAVRLVIEI